VQKTARVLPNAVASWLNAKDLALDCESLVDPPNFSSIARKSGRTPPALATRRSVSA
jgi:hypothetical protein